MSRLTLLASLLLLGLAGCPTPPRPSLPGGLPPEYETPRGYTPDRNIDGSQASGESEVDDDTAVAPPPLTPTTTATPEAPPAGDATQAKPAGVDTTSTDAAPNNTALPPAPGE